MKRIFITIFCLMASMVTWAEGSFQWGISPSGRTQPLKPTTSLFIHATEGKWIQFNICNVNNKSTTIGVYNTVVNGEGKFQAHELKVTLTSALPTMSCSDPMTGTLAASSLQYQVPAGESGVYMINMDSDENGVSYDNEVRHKLWDLSATDGPTDLITPSESTGQVFSYTWQNWTYSASQSEATSTTLYVLTDGGFTDTHYVWALMLNDFSGYGYDISANHIGLNAPHSGMSISEGSTTDPIARYPVYLSYPKAANPKPAPIQIPNFEPGKEPIFSNESEDADFFNPDLSEKGAFIFTPNVTGTYAVIVDTNSDGIYGDNDTVLIGTMTKNVEVTQLWTGKDSSGNSLPQGEYGSQVELRVGEYHFVARDAETSGGGVDNGLTIMQATNEHTFEGTHIYWDDKSQLGFESKLSPSTITSLAATGSHRHTWGDFTNSGMGNNTYIDTYVYGNSLRYTLISEVQHTGTPEWVGGNTKSVQVMEGGNEATDFELVDNTGTAPYTFTLGGADSDDFSIEPGNILQFIATTDYQNPTDQGTDNTYNIVVIVTDGDGKSSQQAISVKILENQRPTANDLTKNTPENVTFEIELLANDGDNHPLTYTLANLPGFGTLSALVGNRLTYTPNTDYIGTDQFEFFVNDGIHSSANSVIRINIGNDFDEDGIPNFLDSDSDNDGIPDLIEGTFDTDSDGMPDHIDIDSDNDGYLDSQENGDFNNDGINDRLQAATTVETGVNGAGSLNIFSLIALFATLWSRCTNFSVPRQLLLIAISCTLIISPATQASCEVYNSEDLLPGCWYAGIGLGVSYVHPDKKETSWYVTKESDSAYKLQVGYQFDSQWYAEVNYVNLGSAELSNHNPMISHTLDVPYHSMNLSLGHIFFEHTAPWNLYAQLGIGFLDTDSNQEVEQNHSFQTIAGAGVQWDINSTWQLRVGAEVYDIDAQFYGVSLNHYFGQSAMEPVESYVMNITTSTAITEAEKVKVQIPVKVEKPVTPLKPTTLVVNFDNAIYTLSEAQKDHIQKFVAELPHQVNGTIYIAGHTDSVGAKMDNNLLSQQRAQEVQALLSHAFDSTYIEFKVESFGESQPIASNDSEEGRQANRRVIVITQLEANNTL
ncbi:OmpA family protein [Aliivibrio kagoshimensis]|uniref:OmpA family protein n=1 Tax=Aliivibrio kagoshimensis TaxID=2910230 RepID=UPI003D09659F